MKTYPYVILGGGIAAGYAAREFGAQGGKKGELAIITNENVLPYERPSLSKGFLSGKADAGDIRVIAPAFNRQHGIAVYRNFHANHINFGTRRIHGAGGEMIGFEKLLIATGSTARKLDVPGGDLPEVHYLRRMNDSVALRARIRKGDRALVVGSGFIGMEVASVLASKGMDVTMAFPGDFIGGKIFTAELAEYFEAHFMRHGVELHRKEKARYIRRHEGVLAAHFSSGKQWEGELIVAGVGAEPCTVIFKRSQLLESDGSIRTNQYLETSIDQVWAAGDVANYPDGIRGGSRRIEHWDNAVEQGRVAMRNMLGKLQPYIYTPYFFSDFFEFSYEFWGDSVNCDRVVYRGGLKEKHLSVWWLKDNRIEAALLMNRPEEERMLAARWAMRRPHMNAGDLENIRMKLENLDNTFGAAQEHDESASGSNGQSAPNGKSSGPAITASR